MSVISSLGVGSGLELNSLVQGLVSAERAPTQNRIDRSGQQTQTQLSAVGGLVAVTAGLQSALAGLKDFAAPLSARTSGSEAVTATLSRSGNAAPATYSVQVDTLASAQSLATASFDDADDVVGSGTIHLRAGTREAEIAVGDSVQTVAELRDAINASGAGIQAVLVRDGEGQRLLLTSRTSGASGTMEVLVSGSVDPRLASAAMTEAAAARDARFSVNGLSLTAASNQIDDVVPGVSLTLKDVTEGAETTTVTVAQDQAAVRSQLGALVTAYNAVQDRLQATASYNAETREGGPLLGDAGVRSLQSRLAGVFSQALPDAAGGSLLDLGFSVGVDGRVSLDAARLEDALIRDQDGVEVRVAAFADMLTGRLQAFSGSDGLLQARLDGLTGRMRQIADQQQALDQRMVQVEQRLRAQFSALDSMVAQFQSTSQFLTNQLASLAQNRAGGN